MNPGWTRPDELEALEIWARGVCVEIGTWSGVSAEAILRGGAEVLYCVDHYRGAPDDMASYGELCSALSLARLKAARDERLKRWIAEDRVRFVEMDSVEASRAMDRPLDFVFVDGDHSYDAVVRDLLAWGPLVRAGGVLCGHDFSRPSVAAAVLAVFGGRHRAGPGSLWRVDV